MKRNRRHRISHTFLNSKPPVNVFVCAILVAIFPSLNVHAQDPQLWLEVDGHKKLNKHWKYTGSPNLRIETTSQGWSRIGLKNTFSRTIRPWLAAEGGVDVFYTSDPVNEDIGELRFILGGENHPAEVHSRHTSGETLH